MRRGLLGPGAVVGGRWLDLARQPARPRAPPSAPAGAQRAPRRRPHREPRLPAASRASDESFSPEPRQDGGAGAGGHPAQGVTSTFATWPRASQAQGTIRADECLLQPRQQKAVFQGTWCVDDGGRLRARTELAHLPRRQGARPHEDSRASSSARTSRAPPPASSTTREEGRLELPADVCVRMRGPRHAAHRRSEPRAVLERERRHDALRGRGDGKQGGDTLKLAADVRARLRRGPGDLPRARVEQDDVVMTAGRPCPRRDGPRRAGARASSRAGSWTSGSARTGRCRRHAGARRGADAAARAQGSARRSAGCEARVSSRSGSTRQGRLEELQTAQRDASSPRTPLPPEQGAARTLTCAAACVAKLDPASGEPREDRVRARTSSSPKARARAPAQKAFYDGAKAALS